MTTPAGRFQSSRRTRDYLVRAAWNHAEEADRDAWIHDLALRWGLVRDPQALTEIEAQQMWQMIGHRIVGGPPGYGAYRAPSELAIGDLAQLAELMPYLTKPDSLPKLALCGATDGLGLDPDNPEPYGRCTLLLDHEGDWHQEWRGGKVWAEWRGPQPTEQCRVCRKYGYEH